MKVAIDTNRLSDLFRGDQQLSSFLELCEHVFVPLPVLAEYKAGCLGGVRQMENERALRVLFTKPNTHVLLPSRDTADHYARLYLQLKLAGNPIPVNDLWISALVVEHGLTLVTRDEHFRRLPQLNLQYP